MVWKFLRKLQKETSDQPNPCSSLELPANASRPLRRVIGQIHQDIAEARDNGLSLDQIRVQVPGFFQRRGLRLKTEYAKQLTQYLAQMLQAMEVQIKIVTVDKKAEAAQLEAEIEVGRLRGQKARLSKEEEVADAEHEDKLAEIKGREEDRKLDHEAKRKQLEDRPGTFNQPLYDEEEHD